MGNRPDPIEIDPDGLIGRWSLPGVVAFDVAVIVYFAPEVLPWIGGFLARSPTTPHQLGQAGEIAANIVKNTNRIPSLTGTAAYRIPDVLNQALGMIGEVKNVASLSYTSQLRDFAMYASQKGYSFVLWVRATTQLSGPLQREVAAGRITLRFLR